MPLAFSRRRLWMLAAALAVTVAAGRGAPAVGPNLPHVAAIDEALRAFVDGHQASGFVTLVAQHGQILHESALGQTDLATGQPMTPDTMFWIASMTKPMTATALMILVDEGRVAIDDPVSMYIPAFATLKRRDGGAVEETLRIRHLLTHTSGLTGFELPPGPESRSLEQQAEIMAAAPLAFEPGSKWAYGWSMQVVGRIVEIASGQPFDQFLTERIFQPLRMTDATFRLTNEQAQRLATTYRINEQGELEAIKNRFVVDDPDIPQTPMPSGGVFATARDIHRFYQMLLNGGELEGVRLLKSATVQKMVACQTGELTTGFTPGNCWGLGVCVVREPQGVSASLSAGSFGHGGAYGTQVWCDPALDAIYVLMVQRSDLPNSDASDFRKVLQQEGRKDLQAQR